MASNLPRLHDGDDTQELIEQMVVGRESDRERAVRIATSRCATIGHSFELLARMGNPMSYDLDKEDAAVIMAFLEEGLERVRYGLENGGKYAPLLKLRGAATW